jgi:trehalose synthase
MNMLEQLETVVGHDEIARIRGLAERIGGQRLVHVNSTKAGGGVAEILGWMVPLMNELGIHCEWKVLQGNPDFYKVTKGFHNALQGLPSGLKQRDFDLHREVNQAGAEQLDLEAEIVVVHDPQPMFLPLFTPRDRVRRWIWRCHIDASRPERSVWNYLAKAIPHYDATVFSMAAFTRPLPRPMFLIPPSINPLSDKNRALADGDVAAAVAKHGIDPERPFLLQVSRFDRFKDPVGVIRAYKLVKRHYPEMQLVLAGGPADDDPEGPEVLAEVRQEADSDPDVKVLMLPSDSHLAINALQRAATIVLQKSTKEGFGLTVTEALWKGKPVIGGATGGIRLQVYDYQTGFLVHTPEGAAYRILYLMRYADKRERMGRRGQMLVRDHFLLTRNLRDYLSLFLCLDNLDQQYLVA